MSEVKRYDFDRYHDCFRCDGRQEAEDGDYVEFEDFDRVTAERDALQDRLNESDELCSSLERSMKNHRHELGLVQQHLTAADERADVLEGLLREVVALDPRGEFLGWQLDARIDEVLQRVEVVGDE